jgi:hypothetical protein
MLLLIVTCKLHEINPYTYFVDVLQRISVTVLESGFVCD